MQLPIANLPMILEILVVHDAPCFVLLHYREFVQFAATLEPEQTPDVVTVLDVRNEHVFVVVGYDGFVHALRTSEIKGNIDEKAYLERHLDVAEAVARGTLRSGADHYFFQGYFEQRTVILLNSSTPAGGT